MNFRALALPKTYTAQARWKFRGTWQHFEQEITARDMSEAGRVLYSLLPITFFRSQDHAVMIRYPLKQQLELAAGVPEDEKMSVADIVSCARHQKLAS
jgi:hypothetical protein